MINSIEIENFKGFRERTLIELKNFSLFSGLNSSGKSTIAQAFLLIEQSINSIVSFNDSTIPYLKINGENVQLGKAIEAINNEDLGYLGFCICFADSTKLLFQYKIDMKLNNLVKKQIKEQNYLVLSKFDYTTKDFSVKCENINGVWNLEAVTALSFINSIVSESLTAYMKQRIQASGLEYKIDELFNPHVYFPEVDHLIFSSMVIKSFGVNIAYLGACINESYSSLYDPVEFGDYLLKNNYNLDFVELEFTYHYKSNRHFSELMGVSYLPPFRGYPKRIYSEMDEQNPIANINTHIDDVIPYAYDFEQKKIIKGTLLEALNYWIADKFKIASKIEVKELVEDLVSETIIYENGKSIALNNVGFGVSQILPLITKILLSDSNLVIVDEPECHLHPAMQTAVGVFLINMSLTGKKIIIETHSEHIINILSFHLLNYDYLKTRAVSYWVYRENCVSKVQRVEYDELGFIINAPIGFYDEREKITELLSNLRTKKLLG